MVFAARSRFAAEFIGETNILTLTLSLRPGRGPAGWWLDELDAPYGEQLSLPADAGRKALLSLRPEKLTRRPEGHQPDARDVCFLATITESIFSGDIHRYTAETIPGKTLTFKEHRSGSGRSLGVGDKITLLFRADAAVLLPGA